MNWASPVWSSSRLYQPLWSGPGVDDKTEFYCISISIHWWFFSALFFDLFFTRSNVKPIVISPNELFTLLMAGDGTQQKWSRSKGNRPRSRWPNPRSTSSSPSRRKRLRRRRPPPTPPSRRRRPTFPVIWRYYRVFFPVLPNWTSFTGKCKVSFLSIFT